MFCIRNLKITASLFLDRDLGLKLGQYIFFTYRKLVLSFYQPEHVLENTGGNLQPSHSEL